MSDSPLLSKMDALLKKHRGGNEADVDASSGLATAPEAPRHTAAGRRLAAGADRCDRARHAPGRVSACGRARPPAAQPAEPEAPAPSAALPIVSDTLAEQLMSELAPRLSEVMEKQVAAELRKNLDQTVATPALPA